MEHSARAHIKRAGGCRPVDMGFLLRRLSKAFCGAPGIRTQPGCARRIEYESFVGGYDTKELIAIFRLELVRSLRALYCLVNNWHQRAIASARVLLAQSNAFRLYRKTKEGGNSMSLKKILLAALMAFGSSTASQAAPEVLYASPVWPYLTTTWVGEGRTSSGQYHVYDEFTLSGASNIQSVDVGLAGYLGEIPNLNVTIWDANFSTKLYDHTFTLAGGEYTRQDLPGVTADKFSIPLIGVEPLGPGKYYMGWYGDNVSVTSFPTEPGAGTFMTDNGYGPSNADGMAAFQISGIGAAAPVPEPEILAMMFAGLGLLGFARRRAKLAA